MSARKTGMLGMWNVDRPACLSVTMRTVRTQLRDYRDMVCKSRYPNVWHGLQRSLEARPVDKYIKNFTTSVEFHHIFLDK
jgi:hypothetical protein